MLSFFSNLKVKVKIYLLILIGIISLAVVVIPTINELNSTIDITALTKHINNFRLHKKSFHA